MAYCNTFGKIKLIEKKSTVKLSPKNNGIYCSHNSKSIWHSIQNESAHHRTNKIIISCEDDVQSIMKFLQRYKNCNRDIHRCLSVWYKVNVRVS